MKKVITIIVLGVVLTSCGGRWSCKKRYCKATDTKAKTEILASKQNNVIAKP